MARGNVQDLASEWIRLTRRARPSTKRRKAPEPVFGSSTQMARTRGVFPDGTAK